MIVTLGSITESSSLGTMETAPVLQIDPDAGAWALWKKLASRQEDCGHPANFIEHVSESTWLSFTTTLYNPARLISGRCFESEMYGKFRSEYASPAFQRVPTQQIPIVECRGQVYRSCMLLGKTLAVSGRVSIGKFIRSSCCA